MRRCNLHTLNAPCRGRWRYIFSENPFTRVWTWTSLEKQHPSAMCSRPRMYVWDRNRVSWGTRRILGLILEMFYMIRAHHLEDTDLELSGRIMGRGKDSGKNVVKVAI